MPETTKEDLSCYKEMYLHMAKATEDAVRILIKAQQECEDILLRSEPLEKVMPCADHRNAEIE